MHHILKVNRFILFTFFCLITIHSLPSQAFTADKTWQNHFVHNESEIPINKFKAYYFDERTAGIIRHSEIVGLPAANFVRDPFHGIPPENFGAYWIGYFDFQETTNVKINRYQSRAESKIFINGQVFNQKTLDHTFSPGRYKIEVQYVSNYYSVSFLVTMLEDTTIHNKLSLIEALGDINTMVVWYCGAYESDNFDMTVNINTDMSEDPVVLFLSSYQPIVWNLILSQETNLHTIVLSSYGPRSTIKNLPENVRVLHYGRLPYVYKLISKSSSSSNNKNTFKNLAYEIQELVGKKPTGFSGKYGLKSVSIPETNLTEATYSKFGMRLTGSSPAADGVNKPKSRLDRVFE